MQDTSAASMSEKCPISGDLIGLLQTTHCLRFMCRRREYFFVDIVVCFAHPVHRKNDHLTTSELATS
jgi:hypothetical protein